MNRPMLLPARIVLALATALAIGCGAPHATIGDRLPDAVSVLQTSLQTWQRGEPATRLQASDQPITFIDSRWQNGNRLIAFQIDGAPVNEGHTAMVTAQLTLESDDAGQFEEEVRYSIELEPVRVVSAVE
jgi:hypothetical protein